MNQEKTKEEEALREYGNLFSNSNWEVTIDFDQYIYLKETMSGIIICHGKFKKANFDYLGNGFYKMYSTT